MQYGKALNAHLKTKGMEEITEMTETFLKKNSNEFCAGTDLYNL